MRPLASSVWPMMRPGNCLVSADLAQMKPNEGPPELMGAPSGWPSPQAMSAPDSPHWPGGLSTDRVSGLTTPITAVPWPLAQSVRRSASSSKPKKLGC